MSSAELNHLVNLGIVDTAGNQFFASGQADGRAARQIRGVLICGLPRSGTTAFAKALEQLGFSLGSASGTPVAELAALHPPLKAALSAGGDQDGPLLQALEAEVARLAAAAERYVVKLPDYYRVLNRQAIPQGVDLILFVTRDPICVAVRNSKSVHMDGAAALRRAVREYGELIDVASACACPSLLVSYEKLLAMPQDLLTALAERLQVPLDEARREAAVGAVVLNDQRYLESSSLSRGAFQGQIGYYAESRLGGWCFWSGMPQKAVGLEVRSAAGEMVGSGVARRLRQGLVDEGLHPTGRAGFQIDLKCDLPLQALTFFADGVQVSLKPTPRLQRRLRRSADG